MARRGIEEWVFPAATVLLGGFLLFHFVMEHTGGATAAAGGSRVWPPAPDTAALRALPLPRAVPFQATTAGLVTRMEARYEGQLALDEDGLRLRLGRRSGVQTDPDYPRRLELVSVTLALAEPGPAGWTIVRRGTGQELEWVLPRGPGWQGVDLELALGGVGAVDLAGRWPVVEHVLEAAWDPDNAHEPDRTTLHVHLPPDAVRRLLTPTAFEEGGR